MHPKFSVLISLYFRENHLYFDEALQSIFWQTCMPDEVVLVLDGPITNELQSVVDKYVTSYPETLKVIPLPRNLGLGAALSEGLQHCSHELVARMDSDDISKPHRFERLLAAFEQHPDIAVIGSWIDEFTVSTETNILQRRLPENHENLRHWANSRSPLNHVSVMFRKQAVSDCGGYRPFYLFEDYNLWVRMILKGYKFHNIQESLVSVRCSNGMIARRGGLRYARSEYRFLLNSYRLGMYGLGGLIKNLCIRIPVRLMPVSFRRIVYTKLLR
jgi:glycosyltransferase involved in cell wall biosynthesis